GLAHLKILEEEILQLGREVLPCVHHNVIEVELVELLQRRPELDHLGPRPEDGHYLHLRFLFRFVDAPRISKPAQSSTLGRGCRISRTSGSGTIMRPPPSR